MKIRAHAKINVSLAVLGIRSDGYHQLRTIFQSLALHDTLQLEPAPRGLTVECATPGVPLDDRNLVWKAARLVWQAAGRGVDPVGWVHITKRIPAQGGLGGGSADGAAALVGWNQLWDTRLPASTLVDLARRLGADVPFFLCAGTALGVNRGDDVRPLDDAPARSVVLVIPSFGVSTPQAFQWWDEDAGFREAAPPAGTASAGDDPAAVFNDLEAPVLRRLPQLAEIRGRLAGAGAAASAMTGSGSTMFGLFASEEQATRAGAALHDPRWHVVVTRTATRRDAGFGLPVEIEDAVSAADAEGPRLV
jgi:4-diphosphocytidyl-2-C-methyl-D-erythritol kinase